LVQREITLCRCAYDKNSPEVMAPGVSFFFEKYFVFATPPENIFLIKSSDQFI
jgi:hypothetical protein